MRARTNPATHVSNTRAVDTVNRIRPHRETLTAILLWAALVLGFAGIGVIFTYTIPGLVMVAASFLFLCWKGERS